MEFVPKGLDPARFKEELLTFIGRILAVGGEVSTFIGRTPKGDIPVGMVVMHVTGPYAEPHVVWFPEASRRNRLELALGFLVDLKRNFKFHLWVRERDWKLFDHLCKYGVIRTVGKRRNFYPDGEAAFLFQEVTT